MKINVSHFENDSHSSPPTNIIATFGFFDPENIDIDTIINFLSKFFAEIRDIENSCQPFRFRVVIATFSRNCPGRNGLW